MGWSRPGVRVRLEALRGPRAEVYMERWHGGVAVMIVGVVLGTAMTARPQEAERPNRVLRVEQANIDLGRVRPGGEVTATFVLHNEGDREIRILGAKPS